MAFPRPKASPRSRTPPRSKTLPRPVLSKTGTTPPLTMSTKPLSGPLGGLSKTGTTPSLTMPNKPLSGPLGGAPIKKEFRGIDPKVQKNLMSIKAQNVIDDPTISDTFKAPPSAAKGTFGQTLKTFMGSGMGKGKKRGGRIRGYD